MFTQNYGRLQSRVDSRPATWPYGARAHFIEVLDIIATRHGLRDFYILMLSFDDLIASSCNYKARRAFGPRAQKTRGGPKLEPPRAFYANLPIAAVASHVYVDLRVGHLYAVFAEGFEDAQPQLALDARLDRAAQVNEGVCSCSRSVSCVSAPSPSRRQTRSRSRPRGRSAKLSC